MMKTNQTFPRITPADRIAGAARPRVEIYYKSWCPFSQKALSLLKAEGVAFTGIDVTADRVRETEMIQRAGRTSVPQIFLDDEKIGGYDDLKAFVASGAFARRLGLADDTPQAA